MNSPKASYATMLDKQHDLKPLFAKFGRNGVPRPQIKTKKSQGLRFKKALAELF